jgi:hypothetical protein
VTSETELKPLYSLLSYTLKKGSHRALEDM